MNEEEVSRVADFLLPISEASAVGADLREVDGEDDFSLLRFNLQSAAGLDDKAMLGEQDGGTEDPFALTAKQRVEWGKAKKLADLQLKKHSKDLEIAAAYSKSLTRLQGFDGLRTGLALMVALLRKFGHGLHPLIKGSGRLETKFIAKLESKGPLTLISAVRLAPLFESQGRSFSLEHVAVAKFNDSRGGSSSPLNTPVLRRHAASVRKDFVDARRLTVTRCDELLDMLIAELNAPELVGEHNPPVTLAKVKSEIKAALASLDDLFPSATAPSSAPESPDSTAPAPGLSPAILDGTSVVANRESALQSIARIAVYLRTIEPHSPVSYLLQKAVAWARMPLPKLLTEVLAEGSVRDELFRLIGLEQTKESKSDSS